MRYYFFKKFAIRHKHRRRYGCLGLEAFRSGGFEEAASSIMQRILVTILAGLVMLCGLACAASAETLSYASVRVNLPDGWRVHNEMTFSGAVPSHVWVVSIPGGGEALVAALVTEGVADGLAMQAETLLAKVYVESVIVGWGGKAEGDSEGGRFEFCGGEPGYHAVVRFGAAVFDYYGCLRLSPERERGLAVLTWGQEGGEGEEVAGRRLKTLLSVASFDGNH